MAKRVSQRVRDYRRGKAHIDIWVPLEIKKRFLELATCHQLTQSELFENLVMVGITTPIQQNRRIKEESEAKLRLEECNGDHDAAIQRLAEECRTINPKFVYNSRPDETPEETKLRNRFRRIQSKLLAWKKKARSNPD
jgi:hypothetical protein